MNNTAPTHGLNEAQLGKILDVLAPFAERIERVSLFGSRARGTPRTNSDIDLVLYGADVGESLVDRLWTLFQESSSPLKVDVAAYDLVKNPVIKFHIERAGKPLFTQDDLRACPARL
ncbi:MAG: nucleotidyltransferase domain-containing protein [Rhodospirillales bacterium]